MAKSNKASCLLYSMQEACNVSADSKGFEPLVPHEAQRAFKSPPSSTRPTDEYVSICMPRGILCQSGIRFIFHKQNVMTLQQQYCTLEQGKRLVELGPSTDRVTLWHMPAKDGLHGKSIR